MSRFLFAMRRHGVGPGDFLCDWAAIDFGSNYGQAEKTS